MSNKFYQLPSGRVACVDDDCDFPPLHQALKEPNGLIAIGGDLSPARLLLAYKNGIFPWFSEGEPILWWTISCPRINVLQKSIKHQTLH